MIQRKLQNKLKGKAEMSSPFFMFGNFEKNKCFFYFKRNKFVDYDLI